MTWPDDYLIPGIEPFHQEEAGIIYCGRAEEILPLLHPVSIDLTVTSPPYDDLRNYNGFEWEFELIATNLNKTTRTGGIIVWIVGDSCINGSESLSSFKQAIFFNELGLNIHDTMIYEKNNFSNPSNNRYHQIFEYMFVISKGIPTTFNPICDREIKWGNPWGKCTRREKDGSLSEKNNRKNYNSKQKSMRTNIWRYITGAGFGQKDKYVYAHPATFPAYLAKDHIISWSNPGDVVLDCHLGSGTTATHAKELGRKFIGIEISEEYCRIAVKRLRQGVLSFG